MSINPPIIEYLPLPISCYSQREIDHDGALIHYISAENTKPEDPFNIEEIQKILIASPASYHDYIDRDGVLWRFVDHKYRAWHAGKSRCKGWKNLNDNFIGIALAGTNKEPFTEAQYETLAWLLVDYIQRYSILTDNIKGHEQVSGPKVRKDYKPDPGIYFDWLYLGAKIQQLRMIMGV